MCEASIRRVIGLMPFAKDAEYTLEDICAALDIQQCPAESVLERLAREFHGRNLNDP